MRRDITCVDPQGRQEKGGDHNRWQVSWWCTLRSLYVISQDKKLTDSHSIDSDIGNCEECELTLTGSCNKILIGMKQCLQHAFINKCIISLSPSLDSCKNTRITLNGRVITNVLEICKCEELIVNVCLILCCFSYSPNNHRSTPRSQRFRRTCAVSFPSSSLSESFTSNSFGHRCLISLSVSKILQVSQDLSPHAHWLSFFFLGQRLETGFAQMKEKHEGLRDTDQFCVTFVNNVLQQELPSRLTSDYASTESEPRASNVPPENTITILALGASLTEGCEFWTFLFC